MSEVCDAIRPFWLTGIHKVSGHQERGLIGLFADQNFQIYTPISPTTAELHFADWEQVVKAFAADIARMSTASLETVEGITQSKLLPKGAGWLFVRAYYSAFFATHALERMLGRSLTQLDASTTNAIDTVASIFGMLTNGHLERGLYVCVADGKRKILKINKVVSDSGPHEALWGDFTNLLRQVTTEILSQPSNSLANQRVVVKFSDLQTALTDGGAFGKGNWLSSMRNRVNYQHAFGAWFPYRERAAYYDQLFEIINTWSKDPDALSIWPQPGRDMQRFIETCVMIVAMCRELCMDMARRCPIGMSFHKFASISLIDRLGLE